MLNYIWGFMVIAGIGYGVVTGNIAEVGNGALDAANDAVTLCITMAGIMGLWCGVMEIARGSGLIESMTIKMKPIICWLFPGVPSGHKATEYIATNFIANILGLGWAATPAGLKAMEELGKLNNQKKNASDDMCTFLVLNISSLQLIPVNVIAYRSQYGSVNPTAIAGPALAATIISTLTAIVFCKMRGRKAQ